MNVINLIYKVNEDSYKGGFWRKDKIKILGEEFVKNNKNNIELIINGKKSELLYNYKLKFGENKIQIIIKNKIKNLE